MGNALDYEGMLRKIGTRIYQEMTIKKIDKNDLAQKAGVAPGIIYQLRNFKGNPTLKTLDKIAKALDITLGDLCDSTGKHEP
jgi:transcriptional regulator with XRE-family HTH domain